MPPIKNKTSKLFIVFLLWSISTIGQEIPIYIFDTDIVVKKDEIILKNAWAGGLNFIQIESFDFNNDGENDLLVFDRSGNKIMPFIYQKNNNKIKYKYDYSFSKNFPEVINWIKLIDYNCDGKKDIFAYNPLGIEVWDNISTDKKIEFKQILFEYNLINGIQYKEAIKTDTGGEYDTNLNIIYQDIPAIVDIDGNGSLDILNFGLGSAIPEGSTVEFHKNSDPCGLNFTRETSCWGGFAENYTNNSVSLEVCANPKGKKKSIKMHAGSSLLVHDFDGNNLPDMLIGDITFENATLVFNNGDIDNAWMTEMDDNFPNYSTPIKLEYFPGFSMIDIDKNGNLDLIASPAIRGSQNTNSVWRYKNTSPTNESHFILDSKTFLQDEMIDVGEVSNPHLYDINNDGLLDILIGNFGYYRNGGTYESNISYYKNIGSKSEAKFEFIEENYGGFQKYNWLNIYPAFGDLNDDGIADVIIGENSGLIHYFEGNEDENYTIMQYRYLGLDVGNGAMPNLADINNDGLLDLIIGNKKGKLNFYINNGSKSEANFELISDNWGKIDLSDIDVQGAWMSCKILNHPKLGKLLICGTQTGKTYAYKNVSELPNATFELISDNYLDFDEGERATIATGDLNNDTYPDIILGNMSGGLRIALDNTEIIKNKTKLIIYPNPIEDKTNIKIKYKEDLKNLNIEIFDISGRKIYFKIINNEIDVSLLKNGIYIIREQIGNTYLSSKFIVKR